MKQIKASVEQGMVYLNSREIQDMIEASNYIEEVEDISHSILEQDILAYNAKLDYNLLEEEAAKDLEEELGIDDEEEYAALLLEQAEYFIDAAMDEIKDRIETKYHIPHLGSAYDIYGNGKNLNNIQFLLTLSFGDTSQGRLYEVTNDMTHKNPTRNIGGFH